VAHPLSPLLGGARRAGGRRRRDDRLVLAARTNARRRRCPRDREDDELCGFTHFRPFPRTLDGNEACFLDDLWVTESHRGTGLAEALIDQVRAIARQRGWSHVRWVTDMKNAPARALYERIAEDAGLVTYRISLNAEA
jgi:ribosomal protein S18 acetylase RimI-like enzyme